MQLQLYGKKIWVYRSAIDFRRSIDGLSSLITSELKQNPKEGVYLFYNRYRDKIKGLSWHKNGFVLFYKRIESGRFSMHFNRFCRKNIFRLETKLFWASLCRQSIELFKNSLIGRLVMLFFSKHMVQLNSSQGRICRMKGFEALHRLGNFFNKPMILLHNIIEVFNLANRDLHKNTTQHKQKSKMQINGIDALTDPLKF